MKDFKCSGKKTSERCVKKKHPRTTAKRLLNDLAKSRYVISKKIVNATLGRNGLQESTKNATST